MRDPRQIILRPLLNEKGEMLKQRVRGYPFEVAKDANKIEIRQAVEKLFDNVKVVAVNTMTKRGKWRRLRTKGGYTRSWKRAIVYISADSTLDL
jgi:large subunit ribosomal protein L23